jgi:hypothetical protein
MSQLSFNVHALKEFSLAMIDHIHGNSLSLLHQCDTQRMTVRTDHLNAHRYVISRSVVRWADFHNPRGRQRIDGTFLQAFFIIYDLVMILLLSVQNIQHHGADTPSFFHVWDCIQGTTAMNAPQVFLTTYRTSCKRSWLNNGLCILLHFIIRCSFLCSQLIQA